MNIVFIHSHLEPGGVTGVIQSQVAALAGESRRLFLAAGERQSAVSSATREKATVWLIPELEYDSIRYPGNDRFDVASVAHRIAERIQGRLENAGLRSADTLLHWHNHSLGKNAAAPSAVSRLADAGFRLLLQIHDFVEDQRPDNLRHLAEVLRVADYQRLQQVLYPRHANIRFATLTHADAQALRRCGIHQTNVQVIPNGVRHPIREAATVDQRTATETITRAFSLPPDARWVLYPVRGIRRKNVGEFLLWCQLLPEPFYGGLALRPDSDVELRSYERWRRVANDFVPRAIFDTAHHRNVSYATNLAASHCVLSTSVAEGFGMSFLEPWLAGRRVVARDLPAVTLDFRRAGVELPHLYDQVAIPGSQDWRREMTRIWIQKRSEAWNSIPFALRPSPSEGKDLLIDPTADSFDFGRLTTEHQIAILRRIHADHGFCSEVRLRNQTIHDWITGPGSEQTIAANRLAIESSFSERKCQTQLSAAYGSFDKRAEKEAAKENASLLTGKPRLIDVVNQLRPFYPCRTESSFNN